MVVDQVKLLETTGRQSDENLSREESESVVSVMIQIYPIVRPYTIRDSVYNPHNRQLPVNQGILLERCSQDIRSQMLHAAQAQEVPAALGAPLTSTSTVTGSSTGTRPTESSSAPRSDVGEDKTVKVSSAEEKRPIDSQDTKPTTGSSKSENPKSDWTVVSYKHKSTGQQGRRGNPYDRRQFGNRNTTPRGGFVSRGKKSGYVMREPDKWEGRHRSPLQRSYQSPSSQSE